jgi:transketolase
LPPTPAFPIWPPNCSAAWRGELPAGFAQTAVDAVLAAHTKAETVASRKASQQALEASPALPELLGGSADLTGSNLTNTKPPRRRCASTKPACPTAGATSTTACASSAWPP